MSISFFSPLARKRRAVCVGVFISIALVACGQEAAPTQDITGTPSGSNATAIATDATTLNIVPTPTLDMVSPVAALPTLLPATSAALPRAPIPTKAVPPATKTPQPAAPSGPVSPLTGLPIAAARLNQRPIVAMIDNQSDARPQSGLTQASLVYEALAEGGISRYMAVFLDRDVAQIGPIRSARQYFVDLARAFHPFFMHFGGSPAALDTLQALSPSDNAGAANGIINIDGIFRGNIAWRSSARYAPHNAYTSSALLRGAESGLLNAPVVPGYPHKDDAPLASRPAAQSVSIIFLPGFGASAGAQWSYNRATNAYSRAINGVMQVDLGSGNAPVRAANIAIMYTQVAAITNDDKGRLETVTTGEGKAVVIQDGKAIPAHWMRPDLSNLPRFYTTSGTEISLNRGTTWIEIVPTDAQVAY